MQTAARLDFIGLPRLRRCGGSVFFVLERKLVRGCGLWWRGWAWRAAVDCVDEVRLGARLWIVSVMVGFGARLWIVGARVGLGRGCGLWGQGLEWDAAVDCVDEVGLGARLWIVGRGRSWRAAWIVGAGLVLREAVDCIGEGWIGARL